MKLELELSSDNSLNAILDDIASQNIIPRIWKHDHTVWSPEPAEISNRLGWLTIQDRMADEVARLNAFVASVKADGITHVLLLGMGGSSLAPEVFAKTFGGDGLTLSVVDGTTPAAINAHAENHDPATTLFIVATKSGGTVETLSFFKFFYNWTAEALGAENAGSHFVAITDPGSKLEALAQTYNFRETFLNDPNIGGRFSVLSFFGMLPAALVGVDVARLLGNAQKMAAGCGLESALKQNPGALTGAIMGAAAKKGVDKLTFVTSPAIAHFVDWVEQLIAESTGKHGVGILPVAWEPLATPDQYGQDRMFVSLRVGADDTHGDALVALEEAGFPVLRFDLADEYDLGGQFFQWEFATAVAGYVLGIQPFDQPNVESAKVRAREMVTAYQETGQLPEITPTLETETVAVYGSVDGETPASMLATFLEAADTGDYVSVQAYVAPSSEMDAAVAVLREKVRASKQLASTMGYGPRFLHSTGQLHKGDGNNGLFIQITTDRPIDVPIPDTAGDTASGMTFGTLVDAQGLGDRQALLDAGRRVLRLHFQGDAAQGFAALVNQLP